MSEELKETGPAYVGSDEARAEHLAAMRRVRDLLTARGVDSREIDQAVAEDRIDTLLIDTVLIPRGPTYTPVEVAEAAGLSVDDFHHFWRALGFPDVSDDDRAFTDLDVDAFSALAELLKLTTAATDPAVDMIRVLGSSMSRIAEAEIAASPSLIGPTDPVVMAEMFSAIADDILSAMGRVLDYSWRRHLLQASRRSMISQSQVYAGGAAIEMGVGFADLVGYTVLSQELTREALSKMVGRFETLAHDVITSRGGRLVKMIGDEAMFVVGDAAGAADIALSLSEAYSEDELLSDVRVGVAYGAVVARDGDYYGPVVNMASRIVNMAKPGSVLVSDEVHDALVDEEVFTFKSLRLRELKDIGRVQLWVMGRPGSVTVKRDARRYTSRPRLSRPGVEG